MRFLRTAAGVVWIALAAVSLWAANLALPDSFAGWKSARVVRFTDRELAGAAGSDADVLREYGAQAVEQRQFTKQGRQLSITLYRFPDSSAAYGMFTFWRATEMQPLQIASSNVTAAASSDTRLLTSLGNYLLQIEGVGLRGLLEIDLRDMIVRLATGAHEPGPLPTLPTYLPKIGLVENSDRYVLGMTALERLRPVNRGDWVGFAYGAEAEVARYQLAGRTPTLFLFLYPTPQIAIDRARDFSHYFTINEDKPRNNLPPAFLKRSGPLVALVLDNDSANLAGFLLDRVNYSWNITWSERPSRKDESGWAQMLVTVFIGTGLLLAAALIGSFAFAGFRLLLSTYLPGRIFDRPSSTEIIQLNLDKR